MAKAKPPKPATRAFTYTVTASVTSNRDTEANGEAAVRSALNAVRTQPNITALQVVGVVLSSAACVRCGVAKQAHQLVPLKADKYCTECLTDLVTADAGG